MDWANDQEIILMGIRLVAGFLAAVGAIVLWAHSRELPWVFIILGALLAYLETLYTFLETLGVLTQEAYSFQGLSLIRAGFALVIPLLYLVGFLLMVREVRK